MPLDKSKFIQTFKSEAEGYLTTLNQGLVKLEKDPKNGELLNELFRAAHTLKGAARMMGFAGIRDLAHEIEDLFGELKEGNKAFTAEIADQVFSDLDEISKAVRDVATPEVDKSEGTVIASPHASLGAGSAKQSPDNNEIATSPTAPRNDRTSEESIRVPLNRINELLNLIGEMVINKVKSSYKMGLFKRLSKRAKTTEKFLFDLEPAFKEALGIPDVAIQRHGAVLHASQEMEKAALVLNSFHNVESLMSHLREEMVHLSDDVQTEIFHLGPVIDSLQQKMKEIRMLPCSTIFEGFPRLVRDIAREQKKEVEFIIKGEETELDKKVLEAIKGPLIHILRNAVDHGVYVPMCLSADVPMSKEKNISTQEHKHRSTIVLSAFQEGDRVVIEVADNGQGIDLEVVKETAVKKGIVTREELGGMSDREVLQLVFAEGFSTAPIITDVSGRGIGLSVVRSEMERLKGKTVLKSEKEVGTTIRLELPLTIAILQVLLVEAGGVRWGLPTSNLKESLKVPASAIATIENRMIMQLREHSVPVVNLTDILGIKDIGTQAHKDTGTKENTIVIATSLNKQIGFIVDRVFGEEEIFIKNIGPHLGKVAGVSGATILASGEVIVILDIQDLVTQAELAHPSYKPQKKREGQKKKKVLLVEDSMVTRELEKSILENGGYAVETAIDGLDAVEKLEKTRFDVIVSDIMMPRMDGFELCKNVKTSEKLRQIPVIFVTALAKDSEKRKGIEVGAQAYITKSEFDQTHLLETIERLV